MVITANNIFINSYFNSMFQSIIRFYCSQSAFRKFSYPSNTTNLRKILVGLYIWQLQFLSLYVKPSLLQMHTLIMHKLNYIFITIADINNGNWFRGAGHFERIMIKHA